MIGSSQSRDRLHGAEHARRAAHVELHPLHPLRGLDGDAAACRSRGPCRRARPACAPSAPPLYSRTMSFGSCGVPCATHRKLPIPSRSISARPSTVTLQAVARRDVARRVGEEVGRAEVARHHAERARERVPLGDGAAVRSSPRSSAADDRAPSVSGARAPPRGAASWCPCTPTRRRRGRRRPLRSRRASARRHRTRARPTPIRPRLPRGESAGAAQRRRAFGDLPEADQQHSRRTARCPAEMQRLVATGAEVTARRGIARAHRRARRRAPRGDRPGRRPRPARRPAAERRARRDRRAPRRDSSVMVPGLR